MNLTEEFLKHSENRDTLKTLIEHPVFVAAVAALKDGFDAFPSKTAEANPVIAAARFHEIAGMNFLIRGLSEFTKDPEPQKPAPKTKRMPKNLDDLQ